MSRKIAGYQAVALSATRDGAKELMEDLFPKLDLKLTFAEVGGSMAVAASVGDTTPYDRGDVLSCLSELGVHCDAEVPTQSA